MQVELAPDLLTLQVNAPQEALQERCKLVQIGKAANGAHLLIATADESGGLRRASWTGRASLRLWAAVRRSAGRLQRLLRRQQRVCPVVAEGSLHVNLLCAVPTRVATCQTEEGQWP